MKIHWMVETKYKVGLHTNAEWKCRTVFLFVCVILFFDLLQLNTRRFHSDQKSLSIKFISICLRKYVRFAISFVITVCKI